MKAKNLITIILLLFVGVSIGMLAVKSLHRSGETAAAANQAATAPGSEAGGPAMTDGVVAYYLHGNTRCPTCRGIEAYAHEAIEAAFTEELEGGRLDWQVVNYELPGNEHFAAEYELVAPTVVLVGIRGGSQEEWKNLVRVWELVGDKEAFVKYVQEETRALLNGFGA